MPLHTTGFSICADAFCSPLRGGTQENRIGGGIVILDLKAVESAAAKIREATNQSPARRPMVVVVDDEAMNRKAMVNMLEDDYQIEQASNGLEALNILNAQGPKNCAEVILADHRMPVMTGVELFKQLDQRQHPASRILITGYSELANVIEAINTGRIFRYLQKPVEAAGVSAAVRSGVSDYRHRRENRLLLGSLKSELELSAQNSRQLKHAGMTRPPSGGLDLENLTSARKVRVGVMTTDLRGFTSYSNTREPKAVMACLGTLFSRMHELVARHGGIVDQQLGDGLVAVFGLTEQTPITRAAECARDLVQLYPSIHAQFETHADRPLKMGIGIAEGSAALGLLGTKNRTELTLWGSTFELAGRLQELTRKIWTEHETSLAQDKANTLVAALGVHSLVGSLEGFESLSLGPNIRMTGFPDLTQLGLCVG